MFIIKLTNNFICQTTYIMWYIFILKTIIYSFILNLIYFYKHAIYQAWRQIQNQGRRVSTRDWNIYIYNNQSLIHTSICFLQFCFWVCSRGIIHVSIFLFLLSKCLLDKPTWFHETRNIQYNNGVCACKSIWLIGGNASLILSFISR